MVDERDRDSLATCPISIAADYQKLQCERTMPRQVFQRQSGVACARSLCILPLYRRNAE
jgi:hypothetical protein